MVHLSLWKRIQQQHSYAMEANYIRENSVCKYITLYSVKRTTKGLLRDVCTLFLPVLHSSRYSTKTENQSAI